MHDTLRKKQWVPFLDLSIRFHGFELICIFTVSSGTQRGKMEDTQKPHLVQISPKLDKKEQLCDLSPLLPLAPSESLQKGCTCQKIINHAGERGGYVGQTSTKHSPSSRTPPKKNVTCTILTNIGTAGPARPPHSVCPIEALQVLFGEALRTKN